MSKPLSKSSFVLTPVPERRSRIAPQLLDNSRTQAKSPAPQNRSYSSTLSTSTIEPMKYKSSFGSANTVPEVLRKKAPTTKAAGPERIAVAPNKAAGPTKAAGPERIAVAPTKAAVSERLSAPDILPIQLPKTHTSRASSERSSATTFNSARERVVETQKIQKNVYKLRASNISRENYSDIMEYIYSILDLIPGDRIPATKVLKNIINILIINIKKNIKNLKYYKLLLDNLSKESKVLGQDDKRKLTENINNVIASIEKDVPIFIALTEKYKDYTMKNYNKKKTDMDQLLFEISQVFFKMV
jgi:hypothetical protein